MIIWFVDDLSQSYRNLWRSQCIVLYCFFNNLRMISFWSPPLRFLIARGRKQRHHAPKVKQIIHLDNFLFYNIGLGTRAAYPRWIRKISGFLFSGNLFSSECEKTWWRPVLSKLSCQIWRRKMRNKRRKNTWIYFCDFGIRESLIFMWDFEQKLKTVILRILEKINTFLCRKHWDYQSNIFKVVK